MSGCAVRDENGKRCELQEHDPETYHRHGRGESVRYWLQPTEVEEPSS